MVQQVTKLEGFRELSDALGKLNKSTERSLLRRVAIRALEPIQERAKQIVPVDEGHLRDSIVIGTKLTKNAKAADRQEPRQGVRMFLGSASRNAVPREYGTFRTPGTFFLSSSWYSLRDKMLDQVRDDIWKSIEKVAKRAAKRRIKS